MVEGGDNGETRSVGAAFLVISLFVFWCLWALNKALTAK